jgi:hypothetical protein
VAKQILNMPQTGVVLDQVRGTTVTPRVRSDHFLESANRRFVCIHCLSQQKQKAAECIFRGFGFGLGFEPGCN